MPAGQQPAGHVRFPSTMSSRSHARMQPAERLNQAGRINDIAADGRVVVALPGRVQQGEVIRRDKNGNPFFLRLLVNAQGLSRESVPSSIRFSSAALFTAMDKWKRASPHHRRTHPSFSASLHSSRKHIASGRSRDDVLSSGPTTP